MAPVLELYISDGPLFDMISDDLLFSSLAWKHQHLLHENVHQLCCVRGSAGGSCHRRDNRRRETVSRA